jgi:hypothetical protein
METRPWNKPRKLIKINQVYFSGTLTSIKSTDNRTKKRTPNLTTSMTKQTRDATIERCGPSESWMRLPERALSPSFGLADSRAEKPNKIELPS